MDPNLVGQSGSSWKISGIPASTLSSSGPPSGCTHHGTHQLSCRVHNCEVEPGQLAISLDAVRLVWTITTYRTIRIPSSTSGGCRVDLSAWSRTPQLPRGTRSKCHQLLSKAQRPSVNLLARRQTGRHPPMTLTEVLQHPGTIFPGPRPAGVSRIPTPALFHRRGWKGDPARLTCGTSGSVAEGRSRSALPGLVCLVVPAHNQVFGGRSGVSFGYLSREN